MTATRTPAPWTTDATWNGMKAVANMDLQKTICVFPGEFDAETQANAALIAAAPEMLSLLKSFVANEGYISAQHMVDLAKLAIAKAEGE